MRFATLDGAYPIVGHLPEIYRRFPSLCARGQRAHGSLFWVHGGPGPRQLVCADARALDVLKDPGASTSYYAEGFGVLLSGTLFAFDGDEHRRVRGLMSPAFTRGRIRASDIPRVIDEVARKHAAQWVERRRVEVPAAAKDMALEVIFRLIGVPAADVAVWRQQYGRYLLAGLPPRGVGPLHWVATRARDWLDARLGALVDRLRASGESETLVGAMAQSRDEHGAFVERALVVANLRLLVLAGHETTAAAIAWTVLELAGSPRDQDRWRDEADGDLVALGTDPRRFTFAEALLRESLRLYPAVHSVIRRATRPLSVAGAEVAAGTIVNVPLVHLLRDRHARDPDRFLPERWSSRPQPGTLETAMFGSGPHFCIGYHVAIVEGTLFNLVLARALREAGVRLTPAWNGPLPPPVYLPLAHPPRRLSVDLS
jgi:cytochrome P450 family 117 subfamily A